ncbi:hypothetical protein SGRIM128S_08435 [Streptomyces griseomycini]
MPPPPDRARSALERRAMTRAPSWRDRPPATTAAAISPWECPITAVGLTPLARQRAARASIMAQEAGWTTSTRSRPGASSWPRRTAVRDQSTKGARAVSHSSITRANSGEESSSAVAMPAHCEPCPGNTNTAREGDTPFRPSVSRVASASRPASSASRPPVPGTTARVSKAERPVAREYATSAGLRSGCARTCSASRPAAWASASAERADSSHGRSDPRPVLSAEGSVVGGSVRMTWALVPLMPKEETPACRVLFSWVGQGRGSVSSSMPLVVQSTSSLGLVMLRVAGSWPWCRAMTILMTPPTPAAAWAWPRLDLREPRSRGRWRSWP